MPLQYLPQTTIPLSTPQFKFKHFEPAYDGNMRLAKLFVSNKTGDPLAIPNPQITEYILTTYASYKQVLIDTFTNNNIFMFPEIQNRLDFIENNITTSPLPYVTRMLADLIVLIDSAKSPDLEPYIDYNLYQDNPEQLQNLDLSKQPLNIFSSKYADKVLSPEDMIPVSPYTIPWATISGAFGYNTWLYLFFNKLLPVGLSLDLHIPHLMSLFAPGAYNIIEHDRQHNTGVSRIYANSESWADPWILRLRKVYIEIMTSEDLTDSVDLPGNKLSTEILNERLKKGLILFMFHGIHENNGIGLNCDGLDENRHVLGAGDIEAVLVEALLKLEILDIDMMGIDREGLDMFVNSWLDVRGRYEINIIDDVKKFVLEYDMFLGNCSVEGSGMSYCVGLGLSHIIVMCMGSRE